MHADIIRLIAEGKTQDLRDLVSKQYWLLTNNDMETAKKNVNELVALADAIQKPAQHDDGLRYELKRLCEGIENIAIELYEDAWSRYEKLKEPASDPAARKAEIAAMRDALTLLSFPLRAYGAQNKYQWRNYDFWRDQVRNLEQ